MGEPEYVVSRKLKDVSDSLAPFRPPTAPASDIEAEKKKIVESSAPNFAFIQAALAVVALSLICYIFLPVEYAQPVSLLLLSVAVAFGIFLWRR